MGLHFGWGELIAHIAVPVTVIVSFAVIRDLMGVESDNGTDFILVLLAFDLCALAGLLHGIRSLILPKLVENFFYLSLSGVSASFLLAILSLWLTKLCRRRSLELADDGYLHLKRAALSTLVYSPAVVTYLAHVPAFVDIF